MQAACKDCYDYGWNYVLRQQSSQPRLSFSFLAEQLFLHSSSMQE